mgnify:CR=1 FL=1
MRMQTPMPRSALFMPGNNARALEKAQALPCDAVILDLEDSVAPDQKDEARTRIASALSEADFGRRVVAVRTNGLDTADFAADVKVARQTQVIVVPKVSTLDELRACQQALEGSEARLWVMIETSMALLNLREMASSAAKVAPSLDAFVLGANDLAKDSSMAQVPGRWNMVSLFAQAVVTAAAYGLRVMDSVSNNFRDLDAFAAECEQGAALGMAGKTLIHPAQIEGANAAFGPKADEIARAKAIIAAFDLPENASRGAIQIDGEMVERLHIQGARDVLARAQAFNLD